MSESLEQLFFARVLLAQIEGSEALVKSGSNWIRVNPLFSTHDCLGDSPETVQAYRQWKLNFCQNACPGYPFIRIDAPAVRTACELFLEVHGNAQT